MSFQNIILNYRFCYLSVDDSKNMAYSSLEWESYFNLLSTQLQGPRFAPIRDVFSTLIQLQKIFDLKNLMVNLPLDVVTNLAISDSSDINTLFEICQLEKKIIDMQSPLDINKMIEEAKGSSVIIVLSNKLHLMIEYYERTLLNELTKVSRDISKQTQPSSSTAMGRLGIRKRLPVMSPHLTNLQKVLQNLYSSATTGPNTSVVSTLSVQSAHVAKTQVITVPDDAHKTTANVDTNNTRSVILSGKCFKAIKDGLRTGKIDISSGFLVKEPNIIGKINKDLSVKQTTESSIGTHPLAPIKTVSMKPVNIFSTENSIVGVVKPLKTDWEQSCIEVSKQVSVAVIKQASSKPIGALQALVTNIPASVPSIGFTAIDTGRGPIISRIRSGDGLTSDSHVKKTSSVTVSAVDQVDSCFSIDSEKSDKLEKSLQVKEGLQECVERTLQVKEALQKYLSQKEKGISASLVKNSVTHSGGVVGIYQVGVSFSFR